MYNSSYIPSDAHLVNFICESFGAYQLLEHLLNLLKLVHAINCRLNVS